MKINEKNYIEELKNKNTRALEYVIDEYTPLIKGIICKVIGVLHDEGLIDECISDVILAIWSNCYKYDKDKGNFKSWIGAIAKFKAIDYYRKYKTKTNFVDELDEGVTNGISTEDIFLKNLETNKLVSIIEDLDEPDRTIFAMKFLLGEETKKISEVINLSVGNINTRISRRKEKLKKVYKKQFGGDFYHGSKGCI